MQDGIIVFSVWYLPSCRFGARPPINVQCLWHFHALNIVFYELVIIILIYLVFFLSFSEPFFHYFLKLFFWDYAAVRNFNRVFPQKPVFYVPELFPLAAF